LVDLFELCSVFASLIIPACWRKNIQDCSNTLTVQCIIAKTWVAIKLRKILIMLIRMPVELHTNIGDVCIELFVYLGLKPNKTQFYSLLIICVSKIVELK